MSKIYRGTAAMVLVFVLAQLAMCSFQFYELARYDTEIAPFMPTMADPDRTNSVQAVFDWGVVVIPALSQFVLVPISLWLARRSRLSAALCFCLRFSTVILAFSAWFLVLVGFGKAMSTWD